MRMKKTIALLLTLSFLLNACSIFGPKQIDSLKIVLAPVEVPGDLIEASKTFSTDFSARLVEKGYAVAKIQFSVAPTHQEAAKTLVDQSADLAFLPVLTYTDHMDEGIQYFLSTTHPQLNMDPSVPGVYDQKADLATATELLPYRHSLIYTGPSSYGKSLKEKQDSGETLTWIDINQAKWCHIVVTSLDGYIYPSLWLIDTYERRMGELYDHVLVEKGYRDMFAQLASGDCDIAVGPDTLRYDYETLWTQSKDEYGFGQDTGIWNDVGVIGVTNKIYDDVWALRKIVDSEDEVLTPELIKIIKETLIEMAEDPEVDIRLFELLGFDGLVEIDPLEYETVIPALEYVQGIMN
jgi:phosphonate transport system substrate-binding protein